MTMDRGDVVGWMERLREAARSGEQINLAPGLPNDEADPPDAGEGITARQLSAKDIRAVLLEPNLVVDPRGLQIHGALVSGTLDLDHLKLPCRLVFTHCRFENALSFEQAHLPELILNDVVLPGLSLNSTRIAGNCIFLNLRTKGAVHAVDVQIGGRLGLMGAKLKDSDGYALSLDRAEINGGAFFGGMEAAGEVRAPGARITGQLDLTGAKLNNPDGNALTLDGAEISDGVFFGGMEAAGEVRAPGARIAGQLVLTGAKLNNPGGNVLTLDWANINGGAFLGELETTGEVRALGARITGQLVLTGAKLNNAGRNVLTLDGAEISGGAFLGELETTGGVRALGARIIGRLVLTGAKLNNPGGDALTLDGAEIGVGAFLGRLEATGEVRALGARITGQLVLTGAKLNNPGGDALTLDGAEISGGAFLGELETTGEVRALGARITGELGLTGAKLNNAGGDALSLDKAEINGDALLKGLETMGGVRALGARVTGQLDLTGAKLNNPDGNALILDGAEINGDAVLKGLETSGKVRALSARVTGQLDLKGAKLRNPGGDALDLSNATLDTVVLDDTLNAEGSMRLSLVSISVLSVGEKKPIKGLPILSSANGWTVGTLHGFLRTDRNSACAWLDTVDTTPRIAGRKEFEAQPWKELAKFYDQIGQPEDGRRLRFRASKRTTRVTPWTSKLVRWPYGALVGYGYYPAIILIWLTALWIAVVVLCFLNAAAFTPTDLRVSTVTVVSGNQSEIVRVTGEAVTPPSYPSFNPGLFAVDTAIPAAATGQAAAWRVTGNAGLLGLFAAFKGFAWVLTALLLAGITGLLRKD
ncbi:hypothetical protein ART_3407 [Arthrobacter sp. PAMC 25486]|nr:hypothetical protein ART_3407 [Arthrobacter sp. PAMC 25486]